MLCKEVIMRYVENMLSLVVVVATQALVVGTVVAL